MSNRNGASKERMIAVAITCNSKDAEMIRRKLRKLLRTSDIADVTDVTTGGVVELDRASKAHDWHESSKRVSTRFW